tara:strand:+ start:422 stop:1639 length:1218 start_codon:yes stop_codon:yes gene_type:complete
MGGAKKKIQKIIPKEIRPALPAIAAIGLPYLAGAGTFGTKIATLAAKSPGIAAAIANAATQAATQDKFDIKSAALSGLQAGVGAKLQGVDFAKAPKTSQFLRSTGEFLNPAEAANLARAGGIPLSSSGDSIVTGLKTASALSKAAAPVAAIDTAKYTIEMNEKALRDYEAQLREQGIMDSSERRNKIFGYFSRAGYDDSEINSMLDKYGYAYGGRVGYKKGGEIQALIDYLKEKGEDEDEFRIGDLTSAVSGFETAFGKPMMERPQPMGINPGFGNMPRMRLAEGGIPNVMAMRKTIAELIASGVIDEEDVEEAVAQIKNQAMMSMRAPGMAEGGIMNLGGKEMDMRGGGFIPIGAKERADDVPARLSKNEFVMTADAVRAAGGGSINKGAKRMYDLMNKLESKV